MMMNRPYKLRFVNQLVGAFVLLVVVLLLGMILIAARTQQWFVPRHELVAFLPEGELDGLQIGTPVQVLGERAGEVSSIDYADEGRMLQLTLQIAEPYLDQIYADSIIRIRRRLAGVGEVYLDILRGPAHRVSAGPDTPLMIVSEPAPGDELRRITEMVTEVREEVAVVRESMVRAFDRLEQTSTQVADSNRQLQRVLDDVEEFTPRLVPLADDLEESNRQFQETTRVVRDSNEQLRIILDDIGGVTPRLGPLADQTEELLATSQEIADTLRDESGELPGTVRQFRRTVEGADEVIEGLRQHWLLRRHIDQPEITPKIPPSKISPGGIWP